MKEKTVTIDGMEFAVKAISLDQADEIYGNKSISPVMRVRHITAASLKNGGTDPSIAPVTTGEKLSDWTAEELGRVPFFNFYARLRDAALEVNELNSGETQPEAATASTH